MAASQLDLVLEPDLARLELDLVRLPAGAAAQLQGLFTSCDIVIGDLEDGSVIVGQVLDSLLRLPMTLVKSKRREENAI